VSGVAVPVITGVEVWIDVVVVVVICLLKQVNTDPKSNF